MESFIPTNPATLPGGKKLKSFATVDGGANTVESEAVTFTDGTTGAEVHVATEATLAQVADSVRVEGTILPGAEMLVTSGAPVRLLGVNLNRRGTIIQNNGGAGANVRVGPDGVTATTGLRLIPDAILTASPPFLPTGEIWAIAEGASAAVFAMEIV